MKKGLRKIVGIFLAVFMMTGVFMPTSTMAADLPDSIYLTQEASGRCTLCSATMMLRSRMYLSGNALWSSITESAIKSVAWPSEGLKWNWTYSIDNNKMTVAHETVSGISSSQLKRVLDSHPEGIVLYCKNVSHAVFLTGYSGNTFYCADTITKYAGTKRTLENTWLGEKCGSQANILKNVSAYWYISAYSISPTEQMPEEDSRPFKDISANAYYYDAVEWAVKNGITQGRTKTEFCPGEDCTRAQVVTFLWRQAGSPEPLSSASMFSDVSETTHKNFYKAIMWAKEKGITFGYADGTFRPDHSVTRAEFVTFQHRANGEENVSIQEHPFVDVDNVIHKNLLNGILWAHENGITEGRDETHFEPDVNCTRAQVVAFLYRAALR